MTDATDKPAPSDPPRLVASLFLLTLLTGIVDAVSVLGLGKVFTANMTGNVVFLGFSLAGSQQVSTTAASLVALAGFLTGALAGGCMARQASSFGTALAVEVGLLATRRSSPRPPAPTERCVTASSCSSARRWASKTRRCESSASPTSPRRS